MTQKYPSLIEPFEPERDYLKEMINPYQRCPIKAASLNDSYWCCLAKGHSGKCSFVLKFPREDNETVPKNPI
jgi:hypothetical protein